MADEIAKLKKDISTLQKKYDDAIDKNKHLTLDLKKVKLEAQEERFKNEKRVFQFEKNCLILKLKSIHLNINPP